MARILHITEALGGGIAHSVPLLARSQSAKGHEVWLIYSRRADTPSEDVLDRLLPEPIRRLCINMVREISPVADFLSLLAIRRYLKTIRPDVIHLHSSKAGALGRLATAGVGRGEKVFYSPRGLSFLQPKTGKLSPTLYKHVEKFLARLSGTVVAVSDSEKSTICTTLGVNNVLVLENAIEIEKIPRHDASAQPKGKLKVMTCGRISEQKAPWRFAELARQLEDLCDFEWIGGGPDELGWLKDSPVAVSGWLPVEESRRRIAKADIFVLLSQYEGMPITLIEAMVSGVPCVATDVVGNRDLIEHESTGFLVDGVGGAADAIARLIESPELRQSISGAARAAATLRFDAGTLAARSEQIYGIE